MWLSQRGDCRKGEVTDGRRGGTGQLRDLRMCGVRQSKAVMVDTERLLRAREPQEGSGGRRQVFRRGGPQEGRGHLRGTKKKDGREWTQRTRNGRARRIVTDGRTEGIEQCATPPNSSCEAERRSGGGRRKAVDGQGKGDRQNVHIEQLGESRLCGVR